MKDSFDIKHWLKLSFVDGVGVRLQHRLLRAYQTPAAVFSASLGDLQRHVPAKTAANIRNANANVTAEKSVAAALEWLKGDDCYILTMADAAYPSLLLETVDAPPLLYARGDLSLLSKPLIAVVGSRNASVAGVRNTEIFARALSDSGLGVVSGLAQGIDAAAHRGAMKGGTGTIAVIGTGLDITYPKINRPLAAAIAEQGLLLSEFPLGTMPAPANFPRRNRIISGLARACLVAEAALRSGSLITAQIAAEQGREVFAVPGSINSPMHRGCHRLIKQGAKLAENIYDILEELNFSPQPTKAAPHPSSQADPAAEQDTTGDDPLLTHIGYEPTGVDDIAARSGVAAAALMPALLQLEISGKVVTAPGGRYQRV